MYQPAPGLRRQGQFALNRAHGLANVLTHRLSGIEVHLHASVIDCNTVIEQILQRQQSTGLSGLPRCMDGEVLFATDEARQLVQVRQSLQGRDAVVLVRGSQCGIRYT